MVAVVFRTLHLVLGPLIEKDREKGREVPDGGEGGRESIGELLGGLFVKLETHYRLHYLSSFLRET